MKVAHIDREGMLHAEHLVDGTSREACCDDVGCGHHHSSLDTMRASLSFSSTYWSACFRISLYRMNMRSRSFLGASLPQNCHHGFSSAQSDPIP